MKSKILAVVLGIAVGITAGWYISRDKDPAQKIEGEITTVRVFFGNGKMNPNAIDCAKVFPVEREIPKTEGVARAALYELFGGPTVQEISENYNSIFSEKTASILRNVKIQNETAYVDFYDIRQLISEASASCGGAHFLASIGETLKQFSTINRIAFAINGDPAAFYNWMQIGCGSDDAFCDPEPFR